MKIWIGMPINKLLLQPWDNLLRKCHYFPNLGPRESKAGTGLTTALACWCPGSVSNWKNTLQVKACLFCWVFSFLCCDTKGASSPVVWRPGAWAVTPTPDFEDPVSLKSGDSTMPRKMRTDWFLNLCGEGTLRCHNLQPIVIMKKESAMGKIVPLLPDSEKEIAALNISELRNGLRKGGWQQCDESVAGRDVSVSYHCDGYLTRSHLRGKGKPPHTHTPCWFEGMQSPKARKA